MQYTECGEIALVEIKNDFIKGDNRYVARDMRVLKTWGWTKKDSIALAIFAAELVIDIFEKRYPNDDRPRKAIEATKAVLKRDTKKNRAAARAAAWAAWAAWAAAKDVQNRRLTAMVAAALNVKEKKCASQS